MSGEQADQTLRQERARILDRWCECADLNYTQLARKLGVRTSTIRNWLNGICSPNNESLSNLFIWLYDLYDSATRQRYRPEAVEVLDWLALMKLSPIEAFEAAQEIPLEVRAWLEKSVIHQAVWPEPLLAQPYIKRELNEQIIHALTDMQGYRQPRRRVVVLYGIPGSGKTTLAAAVIRQSPCLRAHFRDGAIWLDRSELPATNQSGSLDAIRKEWLTEPSAVALIILDDLPPGQFLDELLIQIGPQVRVLITTQAPDPLRLTLSKHLPVVQVEWIAVGKLTEPEGKELISRLTHKPTADHDQRIVQRVVREAGYPLLLRMLTAEAEVVGWGRVWAWLRQDRGLDIPLGGHASALLEQAWLRLPIEQQTWLRRLGQGIPSGSSFGEVLAAIIWGRSEQIARDRLEVLVRWGWLESVNEVEWGTPNLLTEVLGQPRYRLPSACATFLQQVQQSRVTHWQWYWQLRLIWRFRSLIRPDPAVSLASALTIPVMLLQIPFDLIRLFQSRHTDQSSYCWIGGKLPRFLEATWRAWEGILPAEIRLLNEGRQDYFLSLLFVLFLVLVGVTWYLTPYLSLWVSLGIYAALLGAIGWVIKRIHDWQMVLLLAYGSNEPREVKIAWRLLVFFGARQQVEQVE